MNTLFLKTVCILLVLCKIRLWCFILMNISGLKELNVVTNGIISYSFVFRDFLISIYILNLPFQLRFQ